MDVSPFRLPRVTPFGVVESALEWMSGLSKLESLYRASPLPNDQFEFMTEALSRLGTNYKIHGGQLDNIPKEGALLVVANHPFGGIEGIILASLLGKVRSDVKVLANQLLKRLPELDDLFIGVDVFGGEEAKATNRRAIREANQHLKQGGVLIIFPAGEVSAWQKDHQQITDNTWSQSVAKFIRHAQATSLPIYINGQNSALFYQAGRVHPLLRTAMLPRELLNKAGQSISISIGEPITYSELKGFSNDQDLTQYLRLNTYLMGKHERQKEQSPTASALPIIDPIPATVLAEEIQRLDSEHLLLEQNEYQVYCAPTQRLPNLIQEIGRIREGSFRAVGEGSGQPCDTDHYDHYYSQLFVWNRAKSELVGAYRLGLVDTLVRERGIQALYSRSLFHYDNAFIDALDKSIELGRSVVAPSYQRNLLSLLLLWKGIAAFVVKNPHYTHLFGPVSISNDYSPIARQLIASVMSVHHYDQDKAKLVEPITPLQSNGREFWQTDMLSALASVPLLSKVLTRLEQGNGVPVLLRQYLGMNGKLVCFNVDPAFNNALDGLIVVDLTQVPVKTLGKYMGKENAQAYLNQKRAGG